LSVSMPVKNEGNEYHLVEEGHPDEHHHHVAFLERFENTQANTSEIEVPDEKPGSWISFRTLWAYTGPGFLMCIAYLDPGNLEADLQTGAYTGYSCIWVLFLATLIGLILQSMALRLGVVTGKHLAEVCRENFPRRTSLVVWFMTELAIIGSDIQEVLGSAIALNIILKIPLWAGCIITAADTFTFLAIHLFGVRKLEALFVALVATMTVCFFINFGEQPPTAGQVFNGFVPLVHSYAVMTAVSLIGAVIMPHNLYLHSALVLSRDIDRKNPHKVREATKYLTIDATMALSLSFLINLTVVACFSHHFFNIECATQSTTSACLIGDAIDYDDKIYGDCVMNGQSGVCQEIGLSRAGYALRESLGSAALYIWAVGLLAAGQASTMSGTYAGQFVMEGFLNWSIPAWQRVAVTRLLALGPAIVVALASTSSTTASDEMGEWLNILQSIQLPFALLPLLHFTSSKKIMGNMAIGRVLKIGVWILAGIVLAVNIYLMSSFVLDPNSPSPHETWFYVILIFLGIAYFSFCAYIVKEDLIQFKNWILRRGGQDDKTMQQKLIADYTG